MGSEAVGQDEVGVQGCPLLETFLMLVVGIQRIAVNDYLSKSIKGSYYGYLISNTVKDRSFNVPKFNMLCLKPRQPESCPSYY